MQCGLFWDFDSESDFSEDFSTWKLIDIHVVIDNHPVLSSVLSHLLVKLRFLNAPTTLVWIFLQAVDTRYLFCKFLMLLDKIQFHFCLNVIIN